MVQNYGEKENGVFSDWCDIQTSASDLVCSNEIMGDTFSNTRLQVTEKEM